MFPRLTAAILLSLPLLAAAGGYKNKCCDSVEDAGLVANLLEALGLGDVTGLVGLNCGDLLGLAAECSQAGKQPVSCSNNNSDDLVSIGCIPITVDL